MTYQVASTNCLPLYKKLHKLYCDGTHDHKSFRSWVVEHCNAMIEPSALGAILIFDSELDYFLDTMVMIEVPVLNHMDIYSGLFDEYVKSEAYLNVDVTFIKWLLKTYNIVVDPISQNTPPMLYFNSELEYFTFLMKWS